MDPIPKERWMKFPYTVTGKFVFFPYKHYYKHAFLTKYWIAGLILTIPVYWKINNMVNSPENVATWAEIRRKMYSGENHHHD